MNPNDQSAPGPGGHSPSTGGPALGRLSLRTKALVISNEYIHRQMAPGELAAVLAALAPTEEERRQVAAAVEEELRAARYPAGEILRLVSALVPASTTSAPPAGGGEAAQPAQDEGVGVTRKARPPHLMPFESFQFAPPRAAEGPRSTPVPRGTPPPLAPPTEPLPAVTLQPARGAPAPLPSAGPRQPGAAPFGAQPGMRGVAPEKSLGGLRFTAGGETGPPSHPRPTVPLRHAGPRGGGPLILVADDDPRARMMYRAKLEDMGYAVAEARDGIEAWDRLRMGGIQCAVMDMKMPGAHGLEVLQRMADAGLAIPVVVVTAFDQLADEFVVSTYPALKFVTKPAPPEVVADAVASYVPATRQPPRGS